MNAYLFLLTCAAWPTAQCNFTLHLYQLSIVQYTSEFTAVYMVYLVVILIWQLRETHEERQVKLHLLWSYLYSKHRFISTLKHQFKIPPGTFLSKYGQIYHFHPYSIHTVSKTPLLQEHSTLLSRVNNSG